MTALTSERRAAPPIVVPGPRRSTPRDQEINAYAVPVLNSEGR